MLRLYSVKTGVVKAGNDLADLVLESLKKCRLRLEDKDILAFASKIVATVEGRIVILTGIRSSEKATELAKRFHLQPELAELVLREADTVYGGVERAVLTLKNGILTPNAGIDNKNAPLGSVVLWPCNPRESAIKIREEVGHKTGKQVSVLIVDSGLVPGRIGTTGLALAVAGFKPIKDYRGEKDFYDRPLVVTRHAIADDLASAAHLLMGEAAEKTPIVLIKDAPVDFDNRAYDGTDMMIPFEECIFMKIFLGDSHDS
jgi:coenzyme F420-0:L-glutamate ligase/coenzyme F420-1:gamma-L-glutamate ligase